MTTRHQLNNTELANHIFLEGMYDDDYFQIGRAHV